MYILRFLPNFELSTFISLAVSKSMPTYAVIVQYDANHHNNAVTKVHGSTISHYQECHVLEISINTLLSTQPIKKSQIITCLALNVNDYQYYFVIKHTAH